MFQESRAGRVSNPPYNVAPLQMLPFDRLRVNGYAFWLPA